MSNPVASSTWASRRTGAAGVVVAFTILAILEGTVSFDVVPFVLPIVAAVAVATACPARVEYATHRQARLEPDRRGARYQRGRGHIYEASS